MAFLTIPQSARASILADNAGGQQTVTITGNYGAATCDQTIATGKGWTVTN